MAFLSSMICTLPMNSVFVKLDIMPTTNNTITINRSSIEVLEKGQEELPYSEKQ